MNVEIYENYGGGPTIYTRYGDYLHEGYGSGGRVMATIDGNKIYFGLGKVNLAGIVHGNKVYAGFGSGDPMYTIDGNTMYDNWGGGRNILTASENDPMALAAAGFLRFGDESLRLSCESRIPPSDHHGHFEPNQDRCFRHDSDRGEIMGLAGFGGGASDQGDGYAELDKFVDDFQSYSSGDHRVSMPDTGYVKPRIPKNPPCQRFYAIKREELGSCLMSPEDVIRKEYLAKHWRPKEWEAYYDTVRDKGHEGACSFCKFTLSAVADVDALEREEHKRRMMAHGRCHLEPCHSTKFVVALAAFVVMYSFPQAFSGFLSLSFGLVGVIHLIQMFLNFAEARTVAMKGDLLVVKAPKDMRLAGRLWIAFISGGACVYHWSSGSPVTLVFLAIAGLSIVSFFLIVRSPE